ncbi:hypothetical protein PVAND_016226 [Polypedilum vanderplanki]|uniref:Potassium channel domain-containing protein n=1 Tax=Polypedilum vanderplanki TaxID=319348 RepID=A0A9J6BF89_POLVA|nr:hypothetical protein PVAND_016226 [Polypedilum vanderplanki]
MGDDIFIKRVDFEVNNNEPNTVIPNGHEMLTDDVENLNKPGPPPTCCGKFLYYLDKFGIKAALSHVGLLLGLALYCYAGGWVFVQLEHPPMKENEYELRNNISISRSEFIQIIIDAHNDNDLNENFISEKLQEYEMVAQAAVEGNLQLTNTAGNITNTNDIAFPVQSEKWTLMQAIFFASTICTTIGYGNIAPETFEGRLFCIIFAIFGLPFTLTVIADYGSLFANSVSAVAKKCKTFKFCSKDSKFRTFKGRKWLYAIGAVIFLGFYLSAGAAVFEQWEHWTFFEGFYFSFITMTTIGLGDLVPGEKPMLICTVYILIGLALTSTILELVRRQYVQSWQKLQQLKLGSFADSLRRLGESHGAIDVNDLRSILSVVSMSKKGNKKGSDNSDSDPIEALTKEILQKVKIKQMEKPQLVQIIIYESSV